MVFKYIFGRVGRAEAKKSEKDFQEAMSGARRTVDEIGELRSLIRQAQNDVHDAAVASGEEPEPEEGANDEGRKQQQSSARSGTSARVDRTSSAPRERPSWDPIAASGSRR